MHANISAVAGHLPEALAGFLAAHGGIEVSLEERLTAEILHAVRTGAADVGLVSATVQAPDLRLPPWREDRLVAVLPRGHALLRGDEAGRTPLRLAELAAEPFVGLSPATALQQLYRREAVALGLALRERVNVASFDGVRRMVEAGLGVAILPAAAAAAEPYAVAAGIAVRPLGEPWAARQLALCTRGDPAALPAAARLFASHLLGRPLP